MTYKWNKDSNMRFIYLDVCAIAILALASDSSSAEECLDQGNQCQAEAYQVLVPNVLRVPTSYNKNIQPPGLPCLVKIGFIVEDIMEVNDDDYTVSIKLGMPLYWNDSRLDINGTAISNHKFGMWLHIDPTFKEDIWFPNIIIDNMQYFETINTITSNEKLMLTDNEDLRFSYSAIHKVKFTCELRFESFPFDQHNCYFQTYFESPNFEIMLDFFRNREDWGTANRTTILSYDTFFEPLPQDRLVKSHTFLNGYKISQSVSGFKIKLARKIGVYVFNYYIPSGLFVVVSWVSLIVPPDAIPGRIALIITTFLVLVNIANTVFSSSPTADSINPIQVWILACVTFVFITVLEYTYILFMMRKVKKQILNKSNEEKRRKKNSNNLTVPSSIPESVEGTMPPSKKNSICPTPSDLQQQSQQVHNGLIKDRLQKLGMGMYKEDDRGAFCEFWLVISDWMSGHWETVKDKVTSPSPSEVDLQILMTNVDYAFVWIVIILFLIFNIVYWNWYQRPS